MVNYNSIKLERDNETYTILLNRPAARNSLSEEMILEIGQALEEIRNSGDCRALVLRGAGGFFCAGGDIKDMEDAKRPVPAGEADPLIYRNAKYGGLLHQLNTFPAPVLSLCEGAALGGGFGFACVSDITIAVKSTAFGMPETQLGIPPAQIAPYVVQRMGFTQARRLGVTAERFDGEVAQSLGVVHFVTDTAEEAAEILAKQIKLIYKSSPEAVAKTKEIFLCEAHSKPVHPPEELASFFAQAIRHGDGREGVAAFTEKRSPNWVKKV